MSKRAAMSAIFAAALASATAQAGEPSVEQGNVLFQQLCSHCHAPGPGRPGTYMLGLRMGADQAVLEQRYVPAEYTQVIVRLGMRSMPSYRKSELTDAELASIAMYLARDRAEGETP